MSKPYVYHPEARKEYDEAGIFIEGDRPGYGELFWDMVDKAIDLICEKPGLFPQKHNGVRFCYLGMFRYNIVYLEREQDVVILAIAHTSRKPHYWSQRLKFI